MVNRTQIKRSSVTPFALVAALLMAVLPLAGAQDQNGGSSGVVVVSRLGFVVQLAEADVRYSPPGPVPQRGSAEFSLFHALEDGLVRSLVLEESGADEITWRVLLRDGTQVLVKGGEVSFEGQVVGANSMGLVGFWSTHLGPGSSPVNPFVSVTFLEGAG